MSDAPNAHDTPPLADQPAAHAAEAVLSNLNQAEEHARDLREEWERQTLALQQAQDQIASLQARLVGAQETNTQLAQRLQDSQTQAEQERQARGDAEARRAALQAQADAHRARAEQQRARTKQLEAVLRDIHRMFFSGNVYALILKACLTITGASRGIYITTQGQDSPFRLRAAFDVDGYPQSPPSDFLQAICRKVLDDDQTFVAQSDADLAPFPTPTAPTERFQNAIVAPVSLLKNLNGVVLCADKPNGTFDQEDVQSVIAVGNQAKIAAENGHLRRQLQEAYMSTVAVMADAMEAKDSYTHGHSESVSRYARLIARHLNLTDEERSIVAYAALLHDIGKIGVSDGLLNKPGPLLPEERELVRAHVRLGYDLIQHVPALHPVAEAVLHHHESYDGSGYPDGLKGDAIPIAARIVCVVDSYSAMITRRSYKEAYSDEWARNELRRCAGTQFDPKIVEAFLYVLDLPDLNNLEDEEENGPEMLPLLVFHPENVNQV